MVNYPFFSFFFFCLFFPLLCVCVCSKKEEHWALRRMSLGLNCVVATIRKVHKLVQNVKRACVTLYPITAISPHVYEVNNMRFYLNSISLYVCYWLNCTCWKLSWLIKLKFEVPFNSRNETKTQHTHLYIFHLLFSVSLQRHLTITAHNLCPMTAASHCHAVTCCRSA